MRAPAVSPIRLRTRTRAVVVVVACALVAAACSSGAKSSSATQPTGRVATSHPNIVFILTDDLSWNLVTEQFAPHIVQLERQGETFDHYFVADSLCCPSRSSIFTGMYPHDTHVVTNLPPEGGYQKFQAEDLAKQSFPVALQAQGYATSMLGKYLNGYGDPWGNTGTKVKGNKKNRPAPDAAAFPVAPGWSDWHVANGTGYAEFNYWQNDNGTFDFHRGKASYGVDVVNDEAQSFIRQHATSPFMVEAATFAPHKPYTPAPRNANDFPGLTEPRDPSFDANTTNPPAWLGTRPPLDARQIATIDESYRKRAQAVEAVDKLVADTEATLAAEHLTDKTYLVFSSDNGYHLGQHRLLMGKQTAFDTDIRVPLVVKGPGVPAGKVVSQVVQNVDLAPTFAQLAGATPTGAADGHSLVPLLHPTGADTPWRTAALVEHRGGNTDPSDPDFEGGSSNPTTYEAIRVSAQHLPHFDGPVEAVYVEYADAAHEVEFHDVAKDPYELDNTAGRLTAAQRAELHGILAGLESCHDARACWTAGQPG
jgi:N-acetylglucosamine-6-sulfatase